MHFLDHLREQKLEGEREWQKQRAEEQQREADQAARARAEEEKRKGEDAEKDRIKAEAVYASLPDMVRKAASMGLAAAVVSEGIVDERAEEGSPSRAMVANRRTYYLKGWQIPFSEKCKQTGVPLTIVSERVDVGIGRVLRRHYHFLAVDVEQL